MNKRTANCRSLILATFVLFSMLVIPAWAGTSDAADKVHEGIAKFKSGDFKAASEAFSAADDTLPNELRIAFDRGCAYAAQGEYDKAVEQFQKSAAASNQKLAALSQYNLGSVAVAKAKAKLGEKPEEAVGDARTEAIDSLVQAATHYRDCLGVDSSNSDARYNLETIRLWIKYIDDVWKQRDRQKRREEMNLLQYLEWLEGEQASLRETAKELGGEKPSPRHREAVRETENAQRALLEEIEPLKQKIAAAVSAPSQQPGAAAAAPPGQDSQKAVQLLSGLADAAGQTMTKAADSLAAEKLPEAIKSQAATIETIDQIFMAVAPYANLVQKGIQRQQELIGPSPDEERASAGEQSQPSPAGIDGNEAAWKERFIARYGRILSAKARLELEQLGGPAAKKDAAESTNAAAEPTNAAATPDATDKQAAEKDKTASGEHNAAEKQKLDLKEALQKGVELAPKVEKLAGEAASLLEEQKPGEALPKQQEALTLLKEMLPKQQQQDNKDNKDQDKQNQDQKNKDQKEQNKNDQQKKDQNNKDQSKKDQQKKDQQQQQQQQNHQNKNEGNKQQQQNKQMQNKRDQNKEQAEAVLNRARQRREEYREVEKKLEGYLYRPEKVEKDW